MNFDSTAVIGVGYVGLVYALGLARLGNSVVCVDVDRDKMNALESGILPIFEEGLQTLLDEALASKAIRFSSDYDGVSKCDVLFVAVGTPTDPNTGNANLQYLYSAMESIAGVAPPGSTIVIKSTVPIGTTMTLQKKLDAEFPDRSLMVVSNPEFLREARAVDDFFNPDRIVIGGSDPQAIERIRHVYRKFEEDGVPFVTCDFYTAETIKYAANAFLATKLTFINEIANLTEVLGGDIQAVAYGLGLDKRVGDQFLKVGPGYGGSCFPKDTLALATIARRHGVQQQILESVISANDNRCYIILQRLEEMLGGSLANKTVGLLGLAFKANTDDLRDSPATILARIILSEGAHVQAYDPMAKSDLHGKNFAQVESIEAAAKNADLLIIATEWPEFRNYEYNKLLGVVNRRNIFDLRLILRDRAPDLTEWNIQFVGIKPAKRHGQS